MGELPEYTGYDPRKEKPKQVGIEGAIYQFRNEVPDGQLALNLGCGDSPLSGFTNVDWIAGDGVDIVCDLFKPNWPIANDSVGMIFISHMLEHVPPDVWATFWNEMYRICAEGARVMILGPHGRSDRHLGDPTHCQPLVDRKFLYLSKRWRNESKINHTYYGGKDLNFLMDILPWRVWHQDYSGREQSVQQWAAIHEFNVIDDQVWFLKCFKDDAVQAAYMERIEAEMKGTLLDGTPIGDDTP